ncbi:MAG: hypothetical protein GY940_16145 [bacterium]|nr:hypothetical protein [bacterium]
MIWRLFLTKRKRMRGTDEFFDLSKDILMADNLLNAGKYKATILEYKKLIYKAFDYYTKKQKQLMSGTMKKQKLTSEEEKMLKSLGYL